MSHIVAVTPLYPCQECGQARDVRVMPDSGALFATCWNRACPLRTVTLPPDVILTPGQVAEYGRVNDRLDARLAKFAAQQQQARTLGATP